MVHWGLLFLGKWGTQVPIHPLGHSLGGWGGGRGLVEDAHPVASGGGCEDLGKQGLLPTLHVHNTTLKDNTPSYTRLLHIATRNMQCLAQDAQNQISKENATGTPKLLRMGT